MRRWEEHGYPHVGNRASVVTYVTRESTRGCVNIQTSLTVEEKGLGWRERGAASGRAWRDMTPEGRRYVWYGRDECAVVESCCTSIVHTRPPPPLPPPPPPPGCSRTRKLRQTGPTRSSRNSITSIYLDHG